VEWTVQRQYVSVYTVSQKVPTLSSLIVIMDDILNVCCNSAVVLFHLLALIRSEIKIFWLSKYYNNIAVNVTKVVINILQDSSLTQTVHSELVINPLVANFCVICLPKIINIG